MHTCAIKRNKNEYVIQQPFVHRFFFKEKILEKVFVKKEYLTSGIK